MKDKKRIPKGIDDALNEGCEITETPIEDVLPDLVDEDSQEKRPKILITVEQEKVNQAAIAALAAMADENLYQRAGMLAWILKDSSPAAKGIRRPLTPRIDPLPKPILEERMAASADWFKKKMVQGIETEVPCDPSSKSVNAVHVYGKWEGLRHLEAVVDYPVLRPDGTVLDEVGYDAATGLVLMPIGRLPYLEENPTKDDAIAARKQLLGVVADFPFEERTHKAAWLAALLTPLARFAFQGPAPLFLADANVRGAGKGLLMHVIGRILTGKEMTVSTYPQDEDELRKRITSFVISGERMVLFDNLTASLGSGTLDAALTAQTWRDRLLGYNRIVEAPVYVTWFATGNNVALGADTARRTCHIRLESPMENPELRDDFKHRNLLAHVRKNRRTLLGAALTLLRAYVVAGRPDMGLPAWGSFEGWSNLVRSAVVWCGLPDPGLTRQELQTQSDPAASAMTEILRCWEIMDENGRGLTTARVVKELYDGTEIERWHQDMKVAIETLTECTDQKKLAMQLGLRLRTYRKRNFNGRCIDKPDDKRGRAGSVWVVRRFADAGK
ncbi:MAG TPA: hypothetical protein VH643_00820 [Gemmataceae bacterium]